ncbi:MAG: hypothetical protein WKF57_05955 [Nakamurella sp.]
MNRAQVPTEQVAQTVQTVTELLILPAGADPDSSDHRNCFGVFVTWRGQDGYSVTQDRVSGRFGTYLSRAGNWAFTPLPMQRRQYRFTYDEAIAAAQQAVQTRTFQGMSWPEFLTKWPSEKP